MNFLWYVNVYRLVITIILNLYFFLCILILYEQYNSILLKYTKYFDLAHANVNRMQLKSTRHICPKKQKTKLHSPPQKKITTFWSFWFSIICPLSNFRKWVPVVFSWMYSYLVKIYNVAFNFIFVKLLRILCRPLQIQ